MTQKEAGCEELAVALEQKERGHESGKEIVVQRGTRHHQPLGGDAASNGKKEACEKKVCPLSSLALWPWGGIALRPLLPGVQGATGLSKGSSREVHQPNSPR